MIKNMIKNKLMLIIASIIAMCFISACDTKKDESNKIKIVTTTGMVTDLVKNIGGDKVSVQGLMGPGIDPHLYRASEGDVKKLSEADLIFYHGLQLEYKMEEIFNKMRRNKQTIAVTKDINPKSLHKEDGYEDYYDPHIWFDIQLWAQTIDSVTDTLIKHSPKNNVYFTNQSERYKKELQDLHTWITTTLKPIPQNKRVLITAHDAFGYFASAYNFEVLGLQGISTESEAGTKDVQELAKTIVNRKIPAIFIESSVPKRYIQAVQEAVKARGWNVKIGGELFSDAMGNPDTKEGTFIGMVKHNIKTISNGLKGE